MDRRRFLTAAGAAGAGLVAGCAGLGGSNDGDEEPSLAEHPAAANLSDQPTLGAVDGNVVLAFEDTGCVRCQAFEQQTVPKIERRLVAEGEAAFVVRSYPVLYDWARPASEALEATFDRDPDAFWSLLEHYFDTQSSYDTRNVLGRTRTFLAEETAVDAAGVVADVEAGAYADAVDADLTAGMDADLGRTTPIVLLFRDGEYVTQATGSVSYDLIATTLGVS